MENRILPEERTVLKNDNFEIELSNRGAIVRKMFAFDHPLTISAPGGETQAGYKGAFFCAPIVFGRLKNRILNFRGRAYSMPYPEDLDPEIVDPKKIYIHGIHHYYSWTIVSQTNHSVEYKLGAERLPKAYPFPHDTFISYSVKGSELTVQINVTAHCEEMPAMLTMHPFWIYKEDLSSPAPMFKADLKEKFEYDQNSEFPLNWDSPIALEDEAPFASFETLDSTYDHSFLAGKESEIKWPSGLSLKMIDETDNSTCPYSPLQIWTTGINSRNAFGIENGGPANLFWLVDNNKVDQKLLPIAKRGETKSRVVRYQVKN